MVRNSATDTPIQRRPPLTPMPTCGTKTSNNPTNAATSKYGAARLQIAIVHPVHGERDGQPDAKPNQLPLDVVGDVAVLGVRGRARRRKDHDEPDPDERRHDREEHARPAAPQRTNERGAIRPVAPRAPAAARDRTRRGVTHRRAPARPSPPRRIARRDPRPNANMSNDAHAGDSSTTSPRDGQRARRADGFFHRAPHARPGTPALAARDVVGRLADRHERLRALRDRRAELVETRCPLPGRRRSARSGVRKLRSAAIDRAGIRRLRIVDVTARRRSRPPFRAGAASAGTRRALRAAAAGAHPTASAASSAAMTFCTLCSPGSAISSSARTTGIGRGSPATGAYVNMPSRRYIVARSSCAPSVNQSCRACARASPLRQCSSAMRGSSRLPTNQSLIDWLAKIRYFASAYSSIE